MNVQNCKTCKKESSEGANILGVHICTDCLDSIKNIDVEDMNYDHYKDTIGNAWTSFYKLKLN